ETTVENRKNEILTVLFRPELRLKIAKTKFYPYYSDRNYGYKSQKRNSNRIIQTKTTVKNYKMQNKSVHEPSSTSIGSMNPNTG
ncbi:MAG: hypothetical protein ACI4DO_03775, partial [Roseburia sp.]